VHAFASWCPICHQEYAFIKEIRNDPRFQLVGVMVMDNQRNAKRFIDINGNPHAALAFDSSGDAQIQLAITGVPNTLVLDKKGKVVHRVRGGMSREYFQQAVLPVIEKARAA
jgi:cytochrome c biogenesis protein CcmG, thiol:disulfide interchange protein DsbE